MDCLRLRRDAALLIALVCALLVPATARADSKTFNLPAGSGAWVDTQINLADGQTATIEIAGNAKCGAGSDCPAGNPNGSGHTCATRTLGPLSPGPAPAANYGSVASKVGDGSPVMVGAHATVAGPGELQLVYNDCAGYYGDNTGSFTATVTYSPQGVVEGDLLLRDKVSPVGLGGVKVTGTNDRGEAVSKTAAANTFTGHYSVSLDPGTYVIAPDGDPVGQSGGKWDPDACDGTASDAGCALAHLDGGGTLHANFDYTQCGKAESAPADKPATDCPIVFIPGFLGTRLLCGTTELWPGLPHPDFAVAGLAADGVNNATGPCNGNVTAGGLVDQIALGTGRRLRQRANLHREARARPGRGLHLRLAQGGRLERRRAGRLRRLAAAADRRRQGDDHGALDGRARHARIHRRRGAGEEGRARGDARHAVLGRPEGALHAARGRHGHAGGRQARPDRQQHRPAQLRPEPLGRLLAVPVQRVRLVADASARGRNAEHRAGWTAG